LGTHHLSPLQVVYQWTPTYRTPSHDLEKNTPLKKFLKIDIMIREESIN
jgi:hypothetical protein